MSWPELFAQTPTDVTLKEIRTALADRRAEHSHTSSSEDAMPTQPPEPTPRRVVADADVLAADCCVGGPARRVLETLYRHSWIDLVASDPLLEDAENVIQAVTDASVATAWRAQINEWRQPVSHPTGDHPALGSAYRGGSMHILSFDDTLTSSAVGATLNTHVPISVRRPDAFELLFDPESLYATEHDEAYGGPDRPPREEKSS